MLTTNTIRYGADTFMFRIQALLTTSTPWDMTGKTNVIGFDLSGVEPTDSNRRVIFQVDTKYYKFDASQKLVEYTGATDADGVLANGNTVNELSEVTNIPDWVGKRIFPIIALDCAPDATTFPTIKIGLKANTVSETLVNEEESAEYTLIGYSKTMPTIVEIVPNIKLTGKATCVVTVSLKGTDGKWGDYIDLDTAKTKQGVAIKYKAVSTVTALNNGDSAKVENVVIRYKTGDAAYNIAESNTLTDGTVTWLIADIRHALYA